MGTEARTWQLGLILPAGISFYTFQSLSYSIDIRRGRLVPVRSFVDFAMYVAFFPQLIAGPIVRARQFLPQLVRAIPMTRERLSSGLFLILQGLAKKVLMADVLGRLVVDPIMNSPQALATLDVADVALLALGFALQLYGDFAGYSDVAIGSARLFGLELPRNFDSPLRATSLDAFWGRWHISLSTWFRDYVFMPLCGRRASFGRRQSALLATFVIIGLWHGAAFTFVAFGLVHGVGLCSVLAFRRIMPRTAFRSSIWWRGACLAATFGFVCLSSLLFRAATVDDFALVLAALGNWKLDGPVPSWPIGVVLAVGLATHFMPDAMTDRVERGWVRLPPLVQGACLAAALVLFLGLGPADSAPYIYFRF
jgi:D-alanyl-lipoteichoic acid acyltransferase DltB (MBOAT superfamily)